MSGRQRALHVLCIHLASSQEQEALDHVAQFADVSRPRVLLERIDRRIGEGDGLSAVLRADLAGKVFDKSGQVLGAVAQRRQLHGEHNDAMVEIAPEAAGLDQFKCHTADAQRAAVLGTGARKGRERNRG